MVSLLEEIVKEYKSYQLASQPTAAAPAATATSTTTGATQPNATTPAPATAATTTTAVDTAPTAALEAMPALDDAAASNATPASAPVAEVATEASTDPASASATVAASSAPVTVTSSTSLEAESDHKEPTSSSDAPSDADLAAIAAASASLESGSSRTRIGLRAKAAANLVAHRPPRQVPESLSKLLSRLGSLLETQSAEEATVNKFLAVLTLKLVWGRKIIKDRLIIGRLEGQLSKYLAERFKLYVQLRESVERDIEQQRAAAMSDDSGESATTSSFPYTPSWESYMRQLLDYATYTDDILDAMEELETFLPKRLRDHTRDGDANTNATPPVTLPLPPPQTGDIATNSGATPPATQPTATPAETQSSSAPESQETAALRDSILATLWTGIDISPSLYPSAHLPLILSLTSNLYARLPLLWHLPGADASLVTEELVERTIDTAERAAQDDIARREAEEEARAEERAAEERRQVEEERKRVEREQAEAKAQLDREVAEIIRSEQQRKAAKAEAKAAAAAAAAAAAPSSPSSVAAPSPKPPKKSSLAVDSEKKKSKRVKPKRDPSQPIRSSHYAPLPPPSERFKANAPTAPPSPIITYTIAPTTSNTTNTTLAPPPATPQPTQPQASVAPPTLAAMTATTAPPSSAPSQSVFVHPPDVAAQTAQAIGGRGGVQPE